MKKITGSKNLISALLIILLMSGISSSSFASNSVTTNKKNVKGYDEKNKIHYIGTEQELEDFLYHKIVRHENDFIISIDYNKLNADVLDKVFGRLHEKPEVFDFYSQVKFNTLKSKNNKYRLNTSIKYDISKQDKEKVDDYIRKWVKDNIFEGMTEEEKVRAIHDYMVREYHYNYGDKDEKINGYPVYSSAALIFGKGGVCQSYSILFYKMAVEAGLKTKFIEGKTYGEENEGHAWNMVFIGGNWYHIDVTWDDPINGEPSTIYYDYYLKSDEDMGRTHSWDRKKYPKAPYNYENKTSLAE